MTPIKRSPVVGETLILRQQHDRDRKVTVIQVYPAVAVVKVWGASTHKRVHVAMLYENQ